MGKVAIFFVVYFSNDASSALVSVEFPITKISTLSPALAGRLRSYANVDKMIFALILDPTPAPDAGDGPVPTANKTVTPIAILNSLHTTIAFPYLKT